MQKFDIGDTVRFFPPNRAFEKEFVEKGFITNTQTFNVGRGALLYKPKRHQKDNLSGWYLFYHLMTTRLVLTEKVCKNLIREIQ